MSNQKVWYMNLAKQLDSLFYFFDLGFNEENDFAYWFALNQIKSEDRTPEQDDEMWAYVQKGSKQQQRYRSFYPIDKSLLPATMYVTFDYDRNTVLPDFFQIGGGYMIMSERFANILKSHDLGKTQVIPIRFFDLVHHEYVNDTTYYLLNIVEKHQYFLPDLMNPKPYFVYEKDGVDIYRAASTKEIHDNYPYSDKALSCPVDLWAEPSLSGELYISDRLMKSLQQAGLTHLMDLWECQLLNQ